jgi:hypothetical protein
MMRRLFGIAAAAAAMLAPAAARAEWREAETAHFQIYSDGGEGQLVQYAQRLEGLDELLRKATGTPADLPPTKVRVILFLTVASVRHAYHGHDADVAGFYQVNLQGPIAVSTRGKDKSDDLWGADVVLFHEYAHHFMLAYLPATYPAWYVEGFAEIAATTAMLPGGKMIYGKAADHRATSLSYARWIPVSQLMNATYASFPKDADFYGESWLLAHYLTFSQERAGQLRRYLGELGAGIGGGKAAADAFGDLGQLDKEVHAYLLAASFPARAVPVSLPAKEAIRIRALSPAEGDLMPETAAFDEDLEKAPMTAYLAALQAKAARYPDDPYALRLLADAYYAAGDDAAAGAAADRLLAFAPDSVPGRVRKAMVLLRQAEGAGGAARLAKVAEARKLIVAANKSAPDDPQPLVAYYRSFVAAGERPPTQAVDGLRQAVSTLPQDPEARMLLVSQLIAENKLAEAIYYLGPIAYDPHRGGGDNSALDLIDELKQRLAAARPKP